MSSPMTNKQELREKFEQWWEINYHNGNPPRFGWEHWRDGDGYQIDDDESELDGMWEAWQAAHSSKLEAAEKRVAELEASHGNLREAMAGIHNTITGGGAYTPLAAILNASKRAYEESANAAGIRINGEG